MSRKKWERVEAMMKADHIEAINSKVVIFDGKHEHDLYVKLGWADGRWVWIDLTVSRFEETGKTDDDSLVTVLKRQLVETNRTLLEIVCHHASELLQSDERTLDDIVKDWRGTQFDPKGWCESIRNSYNEARVTSALDAAAKLIEQRREQWERQLRAREAAHGIE